MRRRSFWLCLAALALSACAGREDADDLRQWMEQQQREVKPGLPPPPAFPAPPPPLQPGLANLNDPFQPPVRARTAAAARP